LSPPPKPATQQPLKPSTRSLSAQLTALLKAGQLQHSIGPRFSLDQIVQAHETVEAGQSVGNVVVDLI
jgi:NADPH2:quinone reductase